MESEKDRSAKASGVEGMKRYDGCGVKERQTTGENRERSWKPSATCRFSVFQGLCSGHNIRIIPMCRYLPSCLHLPRELYRTAGHSSSEAWHAPQSPRGLSVTVHSLVRSPPL